MARRSEEARVFEEQLYNRMRARTAEKGITFHAVWALADSKPEEARVRRTLGVLERKGLVVRRREPRYHSWATIADRNAELEAKYRERDAKALNLHGDTSVIHERIRVACADLVLQASHAKTRPADLAEALDTVERAIETLGRRISRKS